MKVKKSIILIIIMLVFLNINSWMVGAKTKEIFTVNAKNAIAIDSQTGEVLFEKNACEIVPMASTTKILTALITIERMDIEKKFIVSKNATSVRGSKVGYKVGDEIAIKELLYGLMYRSGNDAAIILAEGMGGSIEGFAEIMNDFARSLGLLDSHFQSPHGLDMAEHYSSAYDLALLTKKGMEVELFREIVGTKSITKETNNFTRDYNNINKILWKIPGANGVKTGYTGQAGKCLVSSINYNGRDVIIVVLNCSDRWNVTEKIFKYIQETVAFQENIVDELAENKYI